MAIKAAGLRLQLCAAATNTDTMNSRGRKINDLQKWRRGWDLNPRYGFPYARFRGECFQPLSHLSAVGFTRLSDDLASRQRYVTQFEIQPALRSISCATSLNERF